MSMREDINNDGTMEDNVTSYVDPLTGYEYVSPGILETADVALNPHSLSGKRDSTKLVFDQAVLDHAASTITEDEFYRIYLQMVEARDNYDMHLGAHMLAEAEEYRVTVYEPARIGYDAALANYESSSNDATREALATAEAELDQASAGVNERSSQLDIMRDMASQTEFGG